MTRAVLSIGSNLGDRLANLRLAVDGLGNAVRAVSPVYETKPWGVTDQPDFLNAVLIADSDGVDEWGWLNRAHELERAADRVRTVHWGPRTLDVDVITVDGVRSADPALLLPHPHAADRAFVLVPWLDIEPVAELPGRGPVAALLAALDRDTVAGARRRDDLCLGVR